MILDQWSIFMHEIRDAGASTSWLAFTVFALMVMSISLVTVNLFLAAMTYTFLQIRRKTRRDFLLVDFVDFASEVDQVATTDTDTDTRVRVGQEPLGRFPMNRFCTPYCKKLVQASWFEHWCLNAIVLNTMSMAVVSHEMSNWLLTVITWCCTNRLQ